MIRIATLGPKGTNHELVTRRYMKFHGIEDYGIDLVDAFPAAIEKLRNGEIDLILQCAVHPATPATMGAAFHEIFVMDSFIADSQELGVLTRREVEEPKSIGLLMPSTSDYTDISRWEEHVNMPSLPLVFEKLMAGEIDSGLIYTSYAQKNPDALRVDEVIGNQMTYFVNFLKSPRPRVSISSTRDIPAPPEEFFATGHIPRVQEFLGQILGH